MSEKALRRSDDRTLWIDFLRIIAMIAVIFTHTTAYFQQTADTATYRVFYSVKPFSQFAVPVFVMISGTFMLDPERSFSTKKLFTKKALRILIALIFWTVVYAVAFYFVGETKGKLTVFLGSLITGPNHLWYLPLLLGLYLLTPLLRKITESECLTKYLLIISFLITFAIPLFLQFCGLADKLLDGRFNTSLTDMIQSDLDDFHIFYTESFVFYYVLGYYLRKKDLSKKHAALLMLLGLLGFACLFGLEYVNCVKTGSFSETLIGMKLACMLTAIGIFTFGKIVIGNRLNGKKSGKIVGGIAKLSFGVYLLQSLVIVLVKEFIFDYTTLNPFLGTAAAIAIVLVISMAITFVLKKIPILNKYIV